MVLASPQRAAALWTNPVCEMKLYKMQWEPWSFGRRGTRMPSASLKEHLFSEDHLVQVFSKQKPLYSRVTFRLFWLEKVHRPSLCHRPNISPDNQRRGVRISFQVQIKDHLLCSADSSCYFSSQQKPCLQSWNRVNLAQFHVCGASCGPRACTWRSWAPALPSHSSRAAANRISLGLLSLIPGPAPQTAARWRWLMQEVNIDLEHRNHVVATATGISYGTSSGVAKDILLNKMICTTTSWL